MKLGGLDHNNLQTYNKFWADGVLVGVLAGALNLNERGSDFLLKNLHVVNSIELGTYTRLASTWTSQDLSMYE